MSFVDVPRFYTYDSPPLPGFGPAIVHFYRLHLSCESLTIALCRALVNALILDQE